MPFLHGVSTVVDCMYYTAIGAESLGSWVEGGSGSPSIHFPQIITRGLDNVIFNLLTNYEFVVKIIRQSIIELLLHCSQPNSNFGLIYLIKNT